MQNLDLRIYYLGLRTYYSRCHKTSDPTASFSNLMKTHSPPPQGVWRACFNDTGDFVASCSLDHTARVWDAQTCALPPPPTPSFLASDYRPLCFLPPPFPFFDQQPGDLRTQEKFAGGLCCRHWCPLLCRGH